MEEKKKYGVTVIDVLDATHDDDREEPYRGENEGSLKRLDTIFSFSRLS